MKKVFITIIVLVIIATIVIDYYDLGLVSQFVGFGFFSKIFKPNPIEAVAAVSLFITIYLTAKASREASRQTELTLRPYLAFSWVSSPVAPGDNRKDQGIMDTCIVVKNVGQGLAKKIEYSISIEDLIDIPGQNTGGTIIEDFISVRNHALIPPHDQSVMVYQESFKDMLNAKKVLGCRNDEQTTQEDNDKIIRNQDKIINIKGYYLDTEDTKYEFYFMSDPNEQSWFSEKAIQKKIN